LAEAIPAKLKNTPAATAKNLVNTLVPPFINSLFLGLRLTLSLKPVLACLDASVITRDA
jgi:hypothetical protein